MRKIVATANEEGKLTAVIHTKYKAQQQDDLNGMLNAVSKERIAEILKAQLNLPSYDISKFDYTSEKGILPVIEELLELTANSSCTISGKRLFIAPNILNKSSSKISGATARKFDVKLSSAFVDIDSVEITIPAGYIPESIPANISLDTKFGTYNCTVKITKGKIEYVRNFQQNSGRFPAADAVPLSEFFSKVYLADRAKIVFVKEENK